MLAKHYKAEYKHKNPHHVECIQLNNLFICAEIEECPITHLIYDEPDFIDEIRDCGYEVEEIELTLPLDESTFSELDFSYSFEYDLFVFKNLAVMATENGLEVFCGPKMTPSRISRHWNLEDKPYLDEICTVPRDRPGELAAKVDHTAFEVWRLCEQGPGETIDYEERLLCLDLNYKALCRGDDLSDVLEDRVHWLNYCKSEWKQSVDSGYDPEHREFHQRCISKAEQLLRTIEELGKECRDVAAELNINRQSQTGDETQKIGDSCNAVKNGVCEKRDTPIQSKCKQGQSPNKYARKD